ncbi:MAG TPA: MMPL family transporter [Burkholderiaceae bacterium]
MIVWSKRSLLAIFWALVVGALLAHNAYLWGGNKIVPDTNILALLPVQERDPVLQESFTHMVDSAQQKLIVLIGADDWEQAQRAADAYIAVLKPHADLLKLSDAASEQTQTDWLKLFQQHRLALVNAQDDLALRAPASAQSKQAWIDSALSKLYSPFAGPKLGSFQDDPFGLFSGWVQARAQETPVRPRDGRLFVADGQRQYVVLPITLQVPAFATSAQEAVTPLLTQARQAVQQAVPKSEVIAAGAILHAAVAGQQATREVSTIGIGSLIGIVLLMWFTFHSIKPIALILLSIGIGCIGALSISSLLFDRIHLLTLVFGASLIGVAQDYGIYFLCNRLGADASMSSAELLKRLMPGLLLTLITTVIGYAGLALTPFPGLQQMAVFSVLGLIFAWFTVIFWFPWLVSASTLKNAHVARLYGVSLARWPLARLDRRTLIAAILFVAFAGFGLSRLGVNDDIRLLQNPPKNLVSDQLKLGKLLDAPTPVQFFLVRGPNSEIVLQREEALKQKLEPFIDQHLISGYQAMSNWVPSSQVQTARRQMIEEKLLRDDGPLAALAEKLGEDHTWVDATRQHILSSSTALSIDEFLQSPSSEPWRHLWLGRVNGSYASIVALRGMSSNGRTTLQHASDGLEGVQWVDKVEDISSVLGRYRQYMGWVVLVSYLAVYVLLFPRYRVSAWRVLMPTAVASIFTLAFMGMIGQPLQLFHVLALMLLLSVGVDYGIFLHEQKNQRDHTAWLAVGLSALSTLLSFGLLGLSKTPALQAFGLTMLIGTASVWMIVPCFRKDK